MRHVHSAIRKQLQGGSAPRPPGFIALRPPAGGLLRLQKRPPREKRPLPYGHRQALRSLPSVALSSCRLEPS